MTDIAKLGFDVDSGPLGMAADRLDSVSDKAAKTERAVDGYTGKTRGAARASEKLAGNTGRLDTSLKSLTGTALKVAGALGGAFAIGAGVRQAISAARELSSATAELSTLLPAGSEQLAIMNSNAARLADTFGTSTTQQVQAFYQAVSAGAGDAAEATKLLDAANRLAIGGITDVTTGVDVLTTATNAYSAAGLSAEDASDSLFVAMKAGKTTIGELAGGLGNVIPIAASLGVRFDELTAGTAALTTQGLSTSAAITGIRQVLAAVAKPTKQAADAAASLGIEFSATALQSKGLAKFLEDIVEKSGGSSDTLAQLFGSVEALNAALSFAGGAGETFTGILEDMGVKAGATDEAFNKVAKSLDFRLNRIIQQFNNKLERAGSILLSIVVPALEAAIAAIDYLQVAAIGAAPVLLSMFGPALMARIGAFAFAVGTTAVGAVRALTFAIATNPLGALAVGISTVVGWLITFRDTIRPIPGELATLGDWIRATWDAVVDGAIVAIAFFETAWDTLLGKSRETNAAIVEDNISTWETITQSAHVGMRVMVATWEGGKAAIMEVWNAFPEAMDNIFDSAAKAIVENITWAVNKGIEAVNWFRNLAGFDSFDLFPGGGGDDMGGGGAFGTGGGVDDGMRGGGGFGDAVGGTGDAFMGAFNESLAGGGADEGEGGFMSDVFAGIRARANELAELRIATEGTTNSVTTMVDRISEEMERLDDVVSSGSKKAGKKLTDTWDNVTIRAVDNFKYQAEASEDSTQMMLGAAQEFFKGHQIIGAGIAFVSTLIGQANALKDLPFPANLAAAAKIGAAGMAFVAAIKSASPTGGGQSTPRVGAGSEEQENRTVGTPGENNQPAPQDIKISLAGSFISREMVEELIKEINDATNDGVRLQVT